MNLEQSQRIQRDHHLPTYARTPLMITGGEGDRVFTEGGGSYLDFLGGIAVNALGHAHPDVIAAAREALDAPLHTSNLFHHPFQAPLIDALCRVSGLERVFFSNSGTEAVEAALKLARLRAHRSGETDRTRFLAFENGFHGRSLGALSVTWPAAYREPFEPLIPGVRFLPLGDEAALEAAVDHRTAAVIVEPIQGEGGVHTASDAFLQRLRAICSERGALLIADEVQCGLGRTGDIFAFQRSGIRPDLVTLAKPLGLGIPLGAMLCDEKVAEHAKPGDHGSTFGGNPLACRLAMVLLGALEGGGLLEHVHQASATLRSGLEELAASSSQILEIRGRGLMLGFEFDGDAAALVQDAAEHGFLINRTAERVVRFLPPLNVRLESITKLLGYLKDALDRVP